MSVAKAGSWCADAQGLKDRAAPAFWLEAPGRATNAQITQITQSAGTPTSRAHFSQASMTSIVGNHHIYDTVQVRLYFVVPGAFQRLNNILESRDIPAAGPTAQPPNGSGDALQSIQAGPLAPATAPTASAQLGTPTNHSMENNSIALKPTPAMTSEEFQIPDTSGSPNPTFLEWTPSEVAALTQLCDDQTRLHDWPQISLQLSCACLLRGDAFVAIYSQFKRTYERAVSVDHTCAQLVVLHPHC